MICSLKLEEGCLVVVQQLQQLQAWLIAEAVEGSGIAACTKHDRLLLSHRNVELLGLSALEDSAALLYVAVDGCLAYTELVIMKDEHEERFVFGELRIAAAVSLSTGEVEVAPEGGFCYIISPSPSGLSQFVPRRGSDQQEITAIDLADALRQLRLPTVGWKIDRCAVLQQSNNGGQVVRAAIAFNGALMSMQICQLN